MPVTSPQSLYSMNRAFSAQNGPWRTNPGRSPGLRWRILSCAPGSKEKGPNIAVQALCFQTIRLRRRPLAAPAGGAAAAPARGVATGRAVAPRSVTRRSGRNDDRRRDIDRRRSDINAGGLANRYAYRRQRQADSDAETHTGVRGRSGPEENSGQQNQFFHTPKQTGPTLASFTRSVSFLRHYL